MKKIIGIIGIAAVLASSMFAAEVSAKVRLTGSLIDYTEADTYSWGTANNYVVGTRATFLKLNEHKAESWNPLMQLSLNTDVAGASFRFYNGGSTADIVTDTQWSLWFKPFDNFKVTVGYTDLNHNQEQIDWCQSKSGFTGNGGYNFEYTMGDFNFGAYLTTGWGNSWIYAPVTELAATIDKSQIGLSGVNRMSKTTLKASYNSPVGTIAASATYDGTKEANVYVGAPMSYNGEDLSSKVIGVKYVDTWTFIGSWNLGSLLGNNFTGFVNVIASYGSKEFTDGINGTGSLAGKTYLYTKSLFTDVRTELYAKATVDAFKFQVFVPITINFVPTTDIYLDLINAPATLQYVDFEAWARADYSLSNGVGLYLRLYATAPFGKHTISYTVDGSTLKMEYSKFSLGVRPGITYSFGACGFEAYIDSTLNLGGDPTVQPLKFTVPVEFTVNF